MNKCSSSDVNRMFMQCYLVLNNVLKMLSQKLYLYIVHAGFLLFFFLRWMLICFVKCHYLFQNIQRKFQSNAQNG